LAKSKKLPNPTSEINIPSETGVKMYRKGEKSLSELIDSRVSKTYSFTATSIPSDWMKDLKPIEYHEEITNMPGFYTPEQRARAEVANIRHKAKQMLNQPFSVTKLYKEFGTTKFPYNVEVNCSRCGSAVIYIVDFFIHGVLDHGNSLSNVEMVLQQLLDKIESKIGSQ